MKLRVDRKQTTYLGVQSLHHMTEKLIKLFALDVAIIYQKKHTHNVPTSLLIQCLNIDL